MRPTGRCRGAREADGPSSKAVPSATIRPRDTPTRNAPFSLSLRVRPSRSRGVPCESLDARDNLPAPRQVAFGQPQDPSRHEARREVEDCTRGEPGQFSRHPLVCLPRQRGAPKTRIPAGPAFTSQNENASLHQRASVGTTICSSAASRSRWRVRGLELPSTHCLKSAETRRSPSPARSET
jgi:hypothetical protein